MMCIYMNLDFNEFLRIMSAIMIVLLIIQGLDYIFGFCVNNYMFILFCICFAFTMGGIYHNIIQERNKQDKGEYKEEILELLNRIDSEGLTNELSEELANKIAGLDKEIKDDKD